MDEEIKKVYLNWSEKGVTSLDTFYAYDVMVAADQALVRCEEVLGEIGMGIGYTSKQADIERVFNRRGTLYSYINALNYYVDSKLDQPLKKDFKKNATETISRIHLENFEVDNTLGLTEYRYTGGGMDYGATTTEQTKWKLTFADFMGTSDGKVKGNGISLSVTNGCVKDFADIFAGQYETMLASGMLGEDNELTKEEFLEQFYHQGEFTHDSSSPFLNFVSSVLDITIIKPVIEACTGEDLITGEDLTDLERGLKVVFAVVDLVTLGGAIGATKLSEMGAKEALQAFGKTVAIDFASNTAACGVGALGEAFDWPVPITIMLSLATGITVSISGNKLLFQNADGIEIGSTVLDDEEVKVVEEKINKEMTGEEWCRYFREEYGAENVVWENATPSQLARSWQGVGKYPGVDNYEDIVVSKGDVIYRGEPNGTEYFTTKEAIESCNRNATEIFEGLQVRKDPVHGYRGNMQGYMVNEDVAAAYGITNANPQFGKGGLPQLFIPDVEDLINKGVLVPVENIPLVK